MFRHPSKQVLKHLTFNHKYWFDGTAEKSAEIRKKLIEEERRKNRINYFIQMYWSTPEIRTLWKMCFFSFSLDDCGAWLKKIIIVKKNIFSKYNIT